MAALVPGVAGFLSVPAVHAQNSAPAVPAAPPAGVPGVSAPGDLTLPTGAAPTADVGTALAPTSPTTTLFDPAKVGEAYVLGPGDSFSVTVEPQEKYSFAATVSSEGTIVNRNFDDPIPANGLTIAQLRQTLHDKLLTFCVNPIVTITMTSLRPQVIYVTGGVAAPHILDVRAASNVAKAVMLSGGATDRGMLQRVAVMRDGKLLHANVYPVLVEGRDSPENIDLQPGDMVVVPVNTAKFSVLGAVTRPGTYGLQQLHGTSEGPVHLSDALSAAGQPLGRSTARIGKIKIMRQARNSTQVVTTTYDYGKYLSKGDLSQNPEIQDNDLIYVPDETHPGPGQLLNYIPIFWALKGLSAGLGL